MTTPSFPPSWWTEPSGPYEVTHVLATRESLFALLSAMTEEDRGAVDVACPWSFETSPDDKRHESGQYVFELLEIQR